MRKRRVEELFAAAASMNERARIVFLDRECADDLELRQRVEELLAADSYCRKKSHENSRGAGEFAPPRPGGVTLAPGRIVGRYLIRRQLGRGGMGSVYLAEDTRLGRLVALKFLHADTSELARCLIHEARMIARCGSEHIVTIYDIGESQGYPYMVLEYLEGGSLRQWIEESTNPPGARAHSKGRAQDAYRPRRDALQIGIQTTQALLAAHDMGIVHQDLKPENIFITTNETIKILDFGIAKALAGGYITPSASFGDCRADRSYVWKNMRVGTPAYMAPEQWTGGEIDRQTDLWAMGVILFELATGRHPLGSASCMTLQKMAMRNIPFPRAEEVAPELGGLATVIDRCLTIDKSRRIQSAQELLEALKNLE